MPALKINDKEYELLLPDDMTMREQMEFEKIADAGVDKLALLDEEYRAGVVVAWMAVSMKRADPTLRMAEVVELLEQMKPAEIQTAWEGLTSEDGQSPPSQSESEPNDYGWPMRKTSSLASGIDREPGTRRGTGDPGSDSSDSDQPTSVISVPGS